MSGMIITAHGSFASGMLEAIGMLTGQDARIQAVDLPPEAGEDAFCDQLKACLDRMEGCGHIYVLCDLLGGTPFKTACLLCRDLKRTDVLYGVNLPFALGLSMQVVAGTDRPESLKDLMEEARQYMGKVG